MEGLLKRRKYLGTFVSSHAPPEDGQHLVQRRFREADSDISTPGLHCAHVQANNPAPRKAEIRATDKTR